MNFLKKAAFSAFSFAFFLFLGELFLRWVAPLEQANHHKLFCEYDSLLGWSKVPGYSGRHQTPEYETLETFNSKGLRSPEYPYEKDSSQYRVLVLGDSYAEGYTVGFDSVFTRVLERQLQQKMADRAPQVVNGGTGGYSTDQELLFYRSEGRRYDPDLVVLLFCINDVWFNSQDKYWRGAKPVFRLTGKGLKLENVPVPEPHPGVKSWLLEHSQIAKRLKIVKDKAMLAREGEKLPEDYRVYAKKYAPAMDTAWTVTEALIIQLDKEVEEDGGKLLVCFVPEQEMVDPQRWQAFKTTYGIDDPEYDCFKPAVKLSDFCRRDSVEFMDPTAAFRKAFQQNGTQLFFPKDSHWNAEGHRVIGEELARRILD